MEQDTLREWEYKCIQEEPPECTAACPIHVDARLFVKEMGRGDREAAFKVLARTMPFPGILARICDHPCELKCKRLELDESLAIGLLERSCVELTTGKVRVQLLPRREQRIAVLGGALAGLTAAWDLLKKGFGVTLFEQSSQLGGSLRELPNALLPEEIINEELAILETLKGDIRLGETLDEARFEEICREFDSVFIDREAIAGCNLPLQLDDRGDVFIDAASGATSREGVYAGGGSRDSGTWSPINETLQGRKGSLSIERFIQKANMEAGRGNDGPYQTRLFTNLNGIASTPRVQPANRSAGFSYDEAQAEAERCIQCECLECVKSCLFLERYQAYPKKYARQVFNNQKVILGAAHTKNQFVNSCSNCGLCETVCPTNFHMGDLCLQARRAMNEQKLMPASFHEFALQDMSHSNGEPFSMVHHEPGREKSAWLYFPSCQLCASSPGEVLSSYGYLRERLNGGVGIMLGCCGAPAYWGGRDDLFRESLATVRSEWQKLGSPRVITACSTCKSLFMEHLPVMEIVSLWKIIEEQGLPQEAGEAEGATVVVADPCSSRHDPETQEDVRRIVQSLGMTIEEIPLSGDKPECCGYGGLMFNANPKLARDVVTRRVATGSGHDYLAYCAMCRDHLAAGGARVSHLIELLFPTIAGGDPAARGWISWSERRTNRTRVKQALLREFGESGEDEMNSYRQVSLIVSQEVRRRIDERRILEDDIRRVIDHAERTGKRLLNSQNGQYRASLQSENVTFWVDYTPEEGRFTVHNSYCHRMKIVGVKS
ncbi:MAG: heterodisulfide reductase-related iron-sulfur binding cluster [Desulfuromonadaceae bacterium]|nr:heterodisulfide reductase-related iron-sulfur binding cluster [Desulfuromonadaceae bacterium]MDD5104996.1 heterodisulfide reductase-related iron-sulfur binding cluster [Desulfuromonadaceae bacterium]